MKICKHAEKQLCLRNLDFATNLKPRLLCQKTTLFLSVSKLPMYATNQITLYLISYNNDQDDNTNVLQTFPNNRFGTFSRKNGFLALLLMVYLHARQSVTKQIKEHTLNI